VKLARRSLSGFTVAEALITIVIMILLGALLYPSVVAAVKRSKVNTSVQRMRQLFVAIETYRDDYGGSDVFNSYRSFYTLGLPISTSPGYVRLVDVPPTTWESPCSGKPWDATICSSAMLPGHCGYISYVSGLYEPEIIDEEPHARNGNRYLYKDYIIVYQQNIALLVDPYCNLSGTHMSAPLTKKRGIALLLSGQVINRWATGNASPFIRAVVLNAAAIDLALPTLESLSLEGWAARTDRGLELRTWRQTSERFKSQAARILSDRQEPGAT
jgi:type II secretory pathway pseudopilin PulG